MRLSYPVLAFPQRFVVTAIAAGSPPRSKGLVPEVQESLKAGRVRSAPAPVTGGSRHAFVIAEVALAVVLLAGAGLLLRSFASLRAVDPGIDTSNVLTMRVALPGRIYNEPAKTLRFYEEAVRKVASVAGVQSAGIISYLPFTGTGAGTASRSSASRRRRRPGSDDGVTVCDNGYFQTMRVAALRGRLFTEREMRERSNVVVVNEALARRYFPNEDIHSGAARDQHELAQRADGDHRHRRKLQVQRSARRRQARELLATSAASLYGDDVGHSNGIGSGTLAPVVEREIQSIDKDQPYQTCARWTSGRAIARAGSVQLDAPGVFATARAGACVHRDLGVMSYVSAKELRDRDPARARRERRDILAMSVGSRHAAGRRRARDRRRSRALLLSRTLSTLLFENTATDPVTFGSWCSCSAPSRCSRVTSRRAARRASPPSGAEVSMILFLAGPHAAR